MCEEHGNCLSHPGPQTLAQTPEGFVATSRLSYSTVTLSPHILLYHTAEFNLGVPQLTELV